MTVHTNYSSVKRIPGWRILGIVTSLLFLIALPFAVKAGRGLRANSIAVPQLRHKIREADIANRIVVQQLRETFNLVSDRIDASGEVSDEDRELLESWKRYDRQFLVSTRNHDAYMFLRSVTHLRIAKVNQLLGNEEEALPEFQAAIELQKQLIEESPETTDYFLELVTSYVSAAASARSMGQTELDISLLMQAVSVARDPRASKSRELKDFSELTSQQIRLHEEQAKAPR